MIDDPIKAAYLLERLREHLPFPTILSPPLMAMIREQSGGLDVPPRGEVIQLHYVGDEGGIVCGLALDIDAGNKVFLASITHLLFNRRMPLAREIAAYQKRRGKRLRRQGRPT